jgi:hypothetical protein
MSDSYKGIVRFDGFCGVDNGEPVSILGWVQLVKGRHAREFPDSHEIIIGGTAAEQEAHIQRVHSDEPARAAAQVRLNLQDRGAKADVLHFLGPLIQRRYVRFQDGSSIWTDLWLQFRNWEATRGPTLWQQLQELRPKANERVGAFGQRAELPQHELADVGRAVTNCTMIDAVLSGWLKERPEWDVVVHSLRTTIGVNEAVATVTQRLMQQEVEQAHTLRVRCPAALAAVSAPAAGDQRWCRMEAALQQVTTAVVGLQQGAGREPTGRGGQAEDNCSRGKAASTSMLQMWLGNSYVEGVSSSLCGAGCAVKWCTML